MRSSHGKTPTNRTPDDRLSRRLPGRTQVRRNRVSFSDETMQSLGELGAVLADVRKRLLAEGYIVRDGILIKKRDQLPKRCNKQEKSEH